MQEIHLERCRSTILAIFAFSDFSAIHFWDTQGDIAGALRGAIGFAGDGVSQNYESLLLVLVRLQMPEPCSMLVGNHWILSK